MKWATLVLLVALAVGCRTNAGVVDERPVAPADASGSAAVATPGAFETAEAWRPASEAASEPVAELFRTFSQPDVERMHRKPDGTYAALIVDRPGNAEGILLTLTEEQGVWRVTSTEIVSADYLWPSQ